MKTTWIYIALAAIVLAIIFLPKNKNSTSSTTSDADAKSKKDISDALSAVTNCTAVSVVAVHGISPYNGQDYIVGQPCHLDWLISIKGWKSAIAELTPDEKTQRDLADAAAANANTTCIMLAAYGTSPYNGQQYQMTVCDLDWLKQNRGWTDSARYVRTNNIITVLPYNM